MEENLPEPVDGAADRLHEAIERYVAASFAASKGDVEEPEEMLSELLALDDF